MPSPCIYPWLPTEIGPLTRPCIVGTISTDDGLVALATSVPDTCDVVELRFDLMNQTAETVFEVAENLNEQGKGVIFTARLVQEGGKWEQDDQTRADLLTSALQYASLVDIEAASVFTPHLIDAASKGSGMLILSSHDFEKTPDLKTIQTRSRCELSSTHLIHKVATLLHGEEDIDVLKTFITEAENQWVCAMGMGLLGPESRIQLGRAGSCLTYGYLDAQAAPGQLSCDELSAAFSSPC